MRNALKPLALILALSLPARIGPVAEPEGEVTWREWSEKAFAEARAQKRLVLLDLGAVWCHWCHVMEETTYRNPRVIALLRDHFVAVRVDQGARPDLSNRYEDYGWPATIVFDGAGHELVKFAGYVAPARMIAMLEAVVADPTPGPSVRPEADLSAAATEASLPRELESELEALLRQRYDREQGGWGFEKKFLDWDAIELCLEKARNGNDAAARMARETLSNARKLIDPIWGGLYQYSDGGDWDHPHFEKLLQFQAEGLRTYARAYALWRDPADLQSARDIQRYVRAFLTSPDGAFYVSQDADLVAGEHSGGYYASDDAARRARGIPRVDRHLYARESGWMAHALVSLYAVTGDARTLREAIAAARWIVARRASDGGGYRHDESDPAGPYLADSLAPARAFLSLYAATGDREWLARAEAAAAFIQRTFVRPDVPGLVSAAPAGAFAPPRPQREENVAAVRFGSLLFQYTGNESHRALARQAMRFLAIPEIARRFTTASVLLAGSELSAEPAHLTVVGPRDDPGARALLISALAEPSSYKRVELWDRRDGPLPRADVEFPELERPAAFVCANGRCSPPAFTPEELRERLRRVSRLKSQVSSPGS